MMDTAITDYTLKLFGCKSIKEMQEVGEVRILRITNISLMRLDPSHVQMLVTVMHKDMFFGKFTLIGFCVDADMTDEYVLPTTVRLLNEEEYKKLGGDSWTM